VLSTIDAQALDLLIGAWLFERAHRDADGLLVLALDGKVLCGAWTDEDEQVTLFSAMVHGKGVTVAQLKVPTDTNEITQVSNLLDTVELPEGHGVVTLDAAHSQRDTADYIKGTRAQARTALAEAGGARGRARRRSGAGRSAGA